MNSRTTTNRETRERKNRKEKKPYFIKDTPTGLGCSIAERRAKQCTDDRIPLNTNDIEHQPYRAVGTITCKNKHSRHAKNIKVRFGSFVFVTTPKLKNSPRLQWPVALTSAHLFYSPDGRKLTVCKVYMNLNNKKWIRFKVVSRIINPQYSFFSSGPKVRHFLEHDWAAFSFKPVIRRKQIPQEIKPAMLTPLDDTRVFQNNNLALVGWAPTSHTFLDVKSSGKIAVTPRCWGQIGSSNVALTANPNLLLHTCDMQTGASGGGTFLDSQLVALNVANYNLLGAYVDPDSFWTFDFEKSANTSILINNNMIKTVEHLALDFQ